MKLRASQLRGQLLHLQDKEKAHLLSRFFKTGKGEYAEGDKFLGLTVVQVREVTKKYREMSLPQIEIALHSPFHEMRLAALILLKFQYEKGDEAVRHRIFNIYTRNMRHINNWDLVDVSAPGIVGTYLHGRDRSLLHTLIRSKNVWERRIALLATAAFIKEGQYEDTLALCELVMTDPHDLIHKAAGWMLREVGKKDERVLRSFLDIHASALPRTMLRYAIEKLQVVDRKRYMSKKDGPARAILR